MSHLLFRIFLAALWVYSVRDMIRHDFGYITANDPLKREIKRLMRKLKAYSAEYWRLDYEVAQEKNPSIKRCLQEQMNSLIVMCEKTNNKLRSARRQRREKEKNGGS